MALRGETIGTAFVRILASGSGLDESIKDEFRGREQTFEQAGRKDSEAYKRGFDDELKKRGGINAMNDRLREAAGRFDRIGEIAGSSFLDGLDKQFKSRFKDEIGDRLGQSLRERLVETMDADEIGRFVDNIGVHVIRVTKDIEKQKKAVLDENARIRESFRKMNSELSKFTGDFKKDVADLVAKTKFDLLSKNIRNFKNELIEIDTPFKRFNHSLLDGSRKTSTFSSTLGNGAREMSNFEKKVDSFGKSLRKREKGLKEFAKGVDKFADGVGSVFGRGNRNNFVNFFGSFVGNIARIPGLLANAGGALVSFGSSISETFAGTGSSAAEFATILGEVAVGAVAAAAVLAGLVILLGVIVSAISLLIGVLIALASTLTFAVAGALAPIAGALLPIAALIGGIFLAFKGLDAELKGQLSTAFKPLLDIFKKMESLLANDFFGSILHQMGHFTKAATILTPVVEALGEGLKTVGKIIGNVADSPAFTKFSKSLTKFLPSAIEDVGHIIGNILRGALGLFRALEGPTSDFLDWVRQLTHDFAKWVNGVKGQSAVKNFLDDAADSAKAVGIFLNGIWDVVKKLFFSGPAKGTGDDIFTSMGNALSDFADSLSKKDIENFFDDVHDFADALGKLFKAIAKVIDFLDSPRGRKLATFFVKLAAIGFEAIAKGIMLVSWALDRLSGIDFEEPGWLKTLQSLSGGLEPPNFSLGAGAEVFGNMLSGIDDFVKGPLHNAVINAGHAIAGFFSDLWSRLPKFHLSDIFGGFNLSGARFAAIAAPFQGLAGKIANSIGKIDLSKIVTGAAGIAGKIFGFLPSPSQIISKMNFDLTRIISSAANFANFLFGFLPSPSEIINKIQFGLDKIVTDTAALFHKVMDAFPTPGEIVAKFVGLGAQIADAIGNIVLNATLNVSMPNGGSLDVWGFAKSVVGASASGGVFADPQMRLIGEAGPEAVVPLRRSLGQVDPAVRALSAVAQGLAFPRAGVDIGGITIITPIEDPEAVASQVINRMAAAAMMG